MPTAEMGAGEQERRGGEEEGRGRRDSGHTYREMTPHQPRGTAPG